MREKKITAVIMSIFMALSLLPSTVFAASAATLDGKLKVKGEAAVGTTLSADMTEVKTEGLTEDGVSYLWSRKASADTENQNLKELGKEKTYTVTQEDLGSKIVLTITGLEDRGFTGSLKAETGEIKEAAPVQQTDAAQNTDVAENSQDTEIPEEEYLEEVPEEEIPEAQEEPAEDVQVQDDPDAESSTEEYTEEIPDTPEAGSEELDGIPAAQEDAVTTGAADQGTEETVQNDEILIPVDPEGEEAGSESVDGIPPAQEDENTVAGDAEPVYSAEISTEDGTNVLDFGEVPANRITEDTVLYVTVKNTGTGTLNFLENTPDHFAVQDVEEPLQPGTETVLWVAPRQGTAAGSYEETIMYTTEEEIQVSFTAKVTLTEEIAKHSLSASPTELEFASAKKGYGQIEAQQITVTNNGNVSETLTQPAGTSFEVSGVDASALTLQPGASVSFTVRPKVGLEPGTYKETIKFASNAAETGVAAAFQVIKGTATINKIETPKDISGLPNGTKKEAKALGLPSTVVIGTTAGNMNASVSWDVKSCNYDPSAVQEQSFTVKGTVKLPDGVDNDNKLTLATSIRVHVKAYAPKTVSADDNRITGIEYNGAYTTQSRISFTAIGAGMDNASPRKGDTRYLPLNWTVINTNGWSSAPPYKATFGMAQSGDYTLKVAFQLQTYDGSTWKNSDNYDTKKVPFSVTKAKVTGPGQNLTPAANRRNAVKTGDSTPILPLVIILVIAAAAIGGVVIYRKIK